MGDRMYLKRWDWDQEKNQTIYHLVMTNIAMERSTIFKFGKPSISTRAIYTMAMLNNQMVPSGKLTKLRKITIVSLTCLMYILYSQVITCSVDIWL